jgi:predicted enzyme related to lactoylglutathione lyase
VLADEPVAGLRPHPGAVRDWTLYLATDDLAARHRVRRLGWHGAGSPAPRGAGGGVKVLVDDAGGATVGLAQPAADWAFGAGAPGGLGWVEFVMRQGPVLPGTVRGYGQRQFGDGKTVDYVVYFAGEDSVVGRVRMDSGTPVDVPPRWIAHVQVNPDFGFEQTLGRARAAGGRLRLPPDPSTLGRVAVLSDPQGTRFAIIDPALASDWDYTSAVDDPYDD